MSDGREYPSVPRVGVGAVVLDGGRVLLVRRGKPPLMGKWSLPGGLVELGETTREAIRREVAEECGLEIRVGEVRRVVAAAPRYLATHPRITKPADLSMHQIIVGDNGQ